MDSLFTIAVKCYLLTILMWLAVGCGHEDKKGEDSIVNHGSEGVKENVWGTYSLTNGIISHVENQIVVGKGEIRAMAQHVMGWKNETV